MVLHLGCPVLDALQGRGFWFRLAMPKGSPQGLVLEQFLISCEERTGLDSHRFHALRLSRRATQKPRPSNVEGRGTPISTSKAGPPAPSQNPNPLKTRGSGTMKFKTVWKAMPPAVALNACKRLRQQLIQRWPLDPLRETSFPWQASLGHPQDRLVRTCDTSTLSTNPRKNQQRLPPLPQPEYLSKEFEYKEKSSFPNCSESYSKMHPS